MPKEDTQFKPGKSGNPKGKPPGIRNFTTKVREALEKIAEGKDYTYEEAFVKSILKKAIVDQDPAMMRLIWNYLDGMPVQMIIQPDGAYENKEIIEQRIQELTRSIGALTAGVKDTADKETGIGT